MSGKCLKEEDKKDISEASCSAKLHFVSFACDAFSSSSFRSSLFSVIRPASVRESGNKQFSTDPVSRDQAPTKWILLLCKAATAFSAGFMAAR